MRTTAALGRAFALAAVTTLAAIPARADQPAPQTPSAVPASTAIPPNEPVPPSTAIPPNNPVPASAALPPNNPVWPSAALPPNSLPPPGLAPAPLAPAPGAAMAPYAPGASPRGGESFASVPAATAESAEQFKRKKRFLIAGASIFGVGYYLGLLAGSVGISRNNRGSREWSGGLVPLVGPFITAGLRAEPNLPPSGQPFPPSQELPDYEGTTLMIAIGTTQLLGAGLLFAGLRMPTGRAPDACQERTSSGPRRPCSSFRISVDPIVTPTFAGAGLTGTF